MNYDETQTRLDILRLAQQDASKPLAEVLKAARAYLAFVKGETSEFWEQDSKAKVA